MLLSLLKTIIGFALIFVSLYTTVFVYADVPAYNFIFHLPSLFLVIGVVIGVSLLLVEYRDIGRFFRFLFFYSVSKEKKKTLNSEAKFEEFLNIYVNESPQALTTFVKENDYPHIWQIIATKLEIRVPISDIKQIMNYKIRKIVGRLDEDTTTLRQLSALAPAIGMFGSVLGLIRLLADMSDFSTLGSNMSLALVTTLYGIFIGNVIFVPLARYVEKRKYMSIKNHENITYWLSILDAKKPAFYLKNSLREITSEEN